MNDKNISNFLLAIKQQGYQIEENIILKEYTSLKIGGPARFLNLPSSIEEIDYIIKKAKQFNIPYYILGNGSNVLIDDRGVQGLIMITKKQFNKIELIADETIKAQAGASLANVCQFAYQNSLTGLEFAWGIPASVGGATYMNAGAYGGEIKDVLIKCTYLNEEGKIETLKNKDLNFAYRQSLFSNRNVVILEAEFKLTKGKRTLIKEKMDELFLKRKTKQPLEYPSAGSTFKRPLGNYASALIEQAGLKGYKKKNSMVSDKHAGFVINHNNASSDEFLALIEKIKEIVKNKTGYELECEIKILK